MENHGPLQIALDSLPDQAALLALVDRLYAETPHSRLDVGGTWTSPKQDLVPVELWPIADAILQALSASSWEISWWANALRPGDALERHHHRQSHRGGENSYAAVYYVQGDDCTILFHPDASAAQEFAPAPGTLLIFPAALEHSVPPWVGRGERISLAFNVRQTE